MRVDRKRRQYVSAFLRALGIAETDEEIIELLNTYFTRVSLEILKHGGMINEFEGDAVLAVFRVEDDVSVGKAATRALAASRAAFEGAAAVNARRVEKGQIPFEFGIALHAGDDFQQGSAAGGPVGLQQLRIALVRRHRAVDVGVIGCCDRQVGVVEDRRDGRE